MNVMLAAAPLALVAALMPNDGIVDVPGGDPSPPPVTTPKTGSGLTYQDILLSSQKEVAGCVLRIGTHVIELEELILGVDEKGILMVAYAQGKNLDGDYVHHDRLDEAAELFESIEDVSGVFVRFDGEPVWAEKVVFGRLPSGDLSTISIRGFREQGAAAAPDGDFESFQDPVPLCLTATPSVECEPVICGHPNTCLAPEMDANGDVTCKCSHVNGTCEPQFTNECPDNGLCTAPKKCKNKVSDPTKCECK